MAGVDWGFAKPWAVVFAAVDEDGRAWLYREFHQAGVGEADQALRIVGARAEDEHIAAYYADDAMFASSATPRKSVTFTPRTAVT